MDAVIPVERNGKRPLVSWAEYQRRVPTEEEAARWRREFPDANAAVITGSVSGRVVLDVDPRHGGDRSIAGKALPVTFTVRTPGGGTHYHYRCPVGGCPTIPSLLPGVDLKGDGGYVLMPPSSIDGRAYEVAADEALSDPPDWLLKLARDRRHTNGQRMGTDEIAQLLSGVEQGTRDTTCARLAGHLLAKGLGRDETLAWLRLWNERNQPRLEDREIIKTVDSIARSESRKKRPAEVVAAAEATFPAEGYVGLADDFASLYAEYTEAPRPFLYFAHLTYLGALLAHRVTLDSELRPSPRLYTVNLGPSADGRKSSALHHTDQFFRDAVADFAGFVHHGLGSAEGLARRLGRDEETKQIRPLVLHLDELRVLVDKARPEGSIILPLLATLFERTSFDNTTKTHTISVRDGYLSLIAACTSETYAAIWTPAFIDIGFTNRLWLVVGQPEKRVALPAPVPFTLREALKVDLGRLLAGWTPRQGTGSSSSHWTRRARRHGQTGMPRCPARSMPAGSTPTAGA